MRAPATTFRGHLREYSQRYLPTPEGVEILKRWEERSDADINLIWNAVKNLPPEAVPTAEELIALVLSRWTTAKEVEQAITQTPDVADAVRKQIDRVWEDGETWRAWLAAIKREVLEDLTRTIRKKSDQLFRRKKAGAARRYFMASWRDKFRELTGQPHDEVVRLLTEIVSGEATTIDEVRKAHVPAKR
jgi:hypothetical protein